MSGGIRSCGHHILDEPAKGCDSGLGLATAEELGAVDVECGEVGPGATAHVLVFHATGRARSGWHRGVNGAARLDAGLLIGGEDVLIRSLGGALPPSGIQVEEAASLGDEIRIPREDPTAVLPRTNRIFVEPMPHCRAADGCDQAAAARLTSDVSGTQTGQRQTKDRRELTRESLHLDDDR